MIPGARIKGGSFAWDIGTAGSATMLALSILPVACFADGPVTARITGGVFQDFAPSPHHLQYVLVPLLKRMGIAAKLQVIRAGYIPQGAGMIELQVRPTKRPLDALTLLEQGSVRQVSGIAFSSHLEERRVSERMARVCEQRLAVAGLSCAIEQVYDMTALHAGANLPCGQKVRLAVSSGLTVPVPCDAARRPSADSWPLPCWKILLPARRWTGM